MICVCKRCNNAYNYESPLKDADKLQPSGPIPSEIYPIFSKLIKGSINFCPSCAVYRFKSEFKAISRFISRTMSRDPCPNCSGKGHLGRNRWRCDKCNGDKRIWTAPSPYVNGIFSTYSFRDPLSFNEPILLPEVKAYLPTDYDRQRGCFISSACTDSKGLPDDCLELMTLRNFRDGFVRNQVGGRQDIETYYAVAPKIVSAINSGVDSRQVYDLIYGKWIRGGVNLILSGKQEEAYTHYRQMVSELERTFLKD